MESIISAVDGYITPDPLDAAAKAQIISDCESAAKFELANAGFTEASDSLIVTIDGYDIMWYSYSYGSSLIIWNGTGIDDSYGDWTFSDDGTETATAMYSGTNGLDTGERKNNNKTTFTTSPAFDVSDAYGSISFWMNPQLKEANTDLMVCWFNSISSVGAELNIADYVSNFDIGVWQKVTISIEDFNTNEQLVDNFKFLYNGQGNKKQQYYFDDIELNFKYLATAPLIPGLYVLVGS
jgi:hypothetical protein